MRKIILLAFLVFSTISYCQEYDYKKNKNSRYNRWNDIVILQVQISDGWMNESGDEMTVFVDGSVSGKSLQKQRFTPSIVYPCCSIANVISDMENQGFQFVQMYDSPVHMDDEYSNLYYRERIMVFRKKK